MNRRIWVWYGFSLIFVITYLIQAVAPFVLGEFEVPILLWVGFQMGLFVVLGLAWFRGWRKLQEEPDGGTMDEVEDVVDAHRSFDDLIGPLVHEINQPLSRLDQRLRQSDHLSDGMKDDLSELKQTVELVRNVFQDNPGSRWFNAVRFLRRLDRRVGHREGLHYRLGMEWLFADPAGLLLALKNLIQNSLEARNGPAQTIVLTIEQQGPEMVISIRDQSGGMERTEARRLTTGSGVTGSSGMGLGLYITRRIVKAHRGRSYINTEDPRGTTITMTFPLPGLQAGNDQTND